MYLIGIILNPLLCFIVIEMSLTLRMMVWRLSYFLRIHLIKHLFGWVKLVLFLYYIALINIGSFKPWWFNVMFTEWRTMTFFSFGSYSFNILHFFVLFLLLFFVEYFIKIATIVWKSFSIAKFHSKVHLHLFLCYCYQTLSFYLIFVKYFFILG